MKKTDSNILKDFRIKLERGKKMLLNERLKMMMAGVTSHCLNSLKILNCCFFKFKEVPCVILIKNFDSNYAIKLFI